MLIVSGTSARVNAYASKNESPYKECSSVVIWHQRISASLHEANLPVLQHDDLFVGFKSKVPFSAFCEQFNACEFNNPKNYNTLTHNCADAAYYALRVAGVMFPLPWIQRRRVFEYSSVLYIPGFILTPIALYDEARKFKLLQLNNRQYFKRWNHAFEQLSQTLHALPNPAGETVLSELIQQAEKNPHLLEYGKKALTSTLKILNESANNDERSGYIEQARFFKHRSSTQVTQWFGRLFDGYISMFFIGQLLEAIQIDEQWLHAFNWIKLLLIMLAICLIMRDVIKHDNGITPLSSAMSELVLSKDIEIISDNPTPKHRIENEITSDSCASRGSYFALDP